MKKEYQKSLFIFRRDLRLEDNTALINALKSLECIIPCFILDPRQVESKNIRRSHPYFVIAFVHPVLFFSLR
jgi:deoxyribodipyrimidine photolyase